MDWHIALAIIVAFAAGYYLGDKRARWSDAVAKNERDRKYGRG